MFKEDFIQQYVLRKLTVDRITVHDKIMEDALDEAFYVYENIDDALKEDHKREMLKESNKIRQEEQTNLDG